MKKIFNLVKRDFRKKKNLVHIISLINDKI